MNDTLRNLGKDELVELLEIYAKNLIALDGTWFQSLEREEGLDTAVPPDLTAGRGFRVSNRFNTLLKNASIFSRGMQAAARTR